MPTDTTETDDELAPDVCEHQHDCDHRCQDCGLPLEPGDMTYYHQGGCPTPD